MIPFGRPKNVVLRESLFRSCDASKQAMDQKKFRSCTIIVFCTIPYLPGRFILRVSRSGTVSIDSRTFDVLNDVIINDVKSLRLSTSAFKPNVPLQTPEMTILVSLNILRGTIYVGDVPDAENPHSSNNLTF